MCKATTSEGSQMVTLLITSQLLSTWSATQQAKLALNKVLDAVRNLVANYALKSLAVGLEEKEHTCAASADFEPELFCEDHVECNDPMFR